MTVEQIFALLGLSVFIAILAGMVAMSFDILPPPDATVLIRIHKSGVKVSKGSLKMHVQGGVTEIVQQAQLSKGFIAITSGSRVRFSRSVPANLHQRLRNVLLN